MPLVPAKCTQCGATLALDPAADAAVCPFCGTPFVVEKAVTYYHSSTTIGSVGHVEHLHVDDARSVEARLQSAEDSLVKLHDHDEAYRVFKSVAADRAGEWRAWWGMARARTHDFAEVLCQPGLGEVQDCVRRAKAVAPPDARASVDRRWAAYQDKVRAARNGEYARLGFGAAEARRLTALQVDQVAARCQELERKVGDLGKRARQARDAATGARNRLLVPVIALIALIPLYHLVERVPLGSGAVSVLGVLACAVFWIAAYVFVQRREAARLDARLGELAAERDRLQADLENRSRLDRLAERWGVPASAAAARTT